MTPKQFVKAYRRYGSIKGVGRGLGVTYWEARKAYLEARRAHAIMPIRVGAKAREDKKEPLILPTFTQQPVEKPREMTVPREGVKRYLFTAAQNNTPVHAQFLTNLLAYAKQKNAELHVSRFSYHKAGLGASGDKATFDDPQPVENITWAKEVTPYLSDKRLIVAPGLQWCGEMNILPTAVRPLSGLEVYTGTDSGIFPHPKIAMESVPTAYHNEPKFNYTTGACTLHNYIQRKAGLKAQFHHCLGALLVEVDHKGHWWARQIHADADGSFYDLLSATSNGRVWPANRPLAITWGDIHVAELDRTVWEVSRDMGLTLVPEYQFFHDVISFSSQSHHDRQHPHTVYRKWITGGTKVRMEVSGASEFLTGAQIKDCRSVIIDSNHHHHIGRWLEEVNGLNDPSNTEFWIKLNLLVYQSIRQGHEPLYLQLALRAAAGVYAADPYTWLHEDESFLIGPEDCQIECGMHGDYGPNGSRGSALAFARMGHRANIGHTHSARIVDGVYQAGTCQRLPVDWTHGPSSWSHSHILTYANGRRTIITVKDGKWRA